ncbi:Rieske 2Fe-2S domain-containing protein, partial [Streptomyces sp. URMC 123]|uniref:Rieske 2Fe-2S domain-containing protein n=1 Tax=Streptomyces sp. URMC 123 TaxID=3423403 RepID=UPI003F1E3D27
MIPDQWYPIALPEEVTADRPTGVRRLGEELVLWRDTRGGLICQTAHCPHKGANLSDGRLRGDTIECPYHGFRFDTGGACTAVPCLGSRARVPKSLRIANRPVRERNGLVWMWWGRPLDTLPEIPIPHEVAEHPALYATGAWQQPVHYTRYTESLLDFYHITFVHRDHWFNYADYMGLSGTVRRLGLDGRRRYLSATKVDNRRLEVDGTTLRYTFDQFDEDDPGNTSHFLVIFTFPGMVHIVNKQFDVTIWITPVDEEHTQVYFRWYEDLRLAPVLRSERVRRLLPKVALFIQKRVQEVQDMRVVSRIEPRVSGRGVNRFVAADELNAKYVSMRERLIREAEARARGGAGAGDPAAAEAGDDGLSGAGRAPGGA